MTMITPINTTNTTPRTWREYSPNTTLQEYISNEMGKVNESLHETIEQVNKSAHAWEEGFDRMERKIDAALQCWSYWQGVMDAQSGKVPENITPLHTHENE